MDLTMMVFVFIVGITWGSFLNVWIYRIPKGESIAKGRSHCTTCNKSLGILDLIPIFSFLFSRGKCRHCGDKVSWQYPIIELITGLLFVMIYYTIDLNWVLWVVSIFVVTVNLVMAKIDWDTTYIPNILSFPSVIIALVYGIFATQITVSEDISIPLPTLTESLIGGAVFFGLILLIFFISNGGMGLGDAIWSLFMGLMLGWKLMFIALFIGSALSSIFSLTIYALFTKKIKSLPNLNVTVKNQTEGEVHKFLGMSIINGKPAIVLGPFLAIGMIITWFYGNQIWEWYLYR